MSNRTISSDRTERFVQQMTDQMTRLARTLSDWGQAEARPLQEIEVQVVRPLHDLGNRLLAALTPLAAPARPTPDVACACGQTARYLRMRPATVITVLGRVTLERAIYRCPTYIRRRWMPNSRSRLAVSVSVCTNCSRCWAPRRIRSPRRRRRLSAAVSSRSVPIVCGPRPRISARRAPTTNVTWRPRPRPAEPPPPADQDAPSRMYLSMDGVVAHVHDAGWKEIKVGCVDTTRTRVPRQRPETLVIATERQSSVAALTDAATFGWQLWADACRRGVPDQTDLVVIGDGAHWIWNLAAEHIPHATQIVDW